MNPITEQKTVVGIALSLVLPLCLLISAPIMGLLGALSTNELFEALGQSAFKRSLWVSIETSLISLTLVLLLGIPTAWLISSLNENKRAKLIPLIEFPIVMPPAVVGLGLLLCFGPNSFLGAQLNQFGISLPFTKAAVIIAQMIVSAPFFISAAISSFSTINQDVLLVARTLGLNRLDTLRTVVIPMTLPSLISGAAISWARSIGEFGATLLFAGSLEGETLTMPLAIYSTLESDVSVAIALAVTLMGIALLLLITLRALPVAFRETARSYRRRWKQAP